MGIIKYFTFGGFGILWVSDIISAKSRCLNANAKRLMEFIATLPAAEADEESDIDVAAMINDSNSGKKKIHVDGKTAMVVGKGLLSIGKSISSGIKSIQDSNDPTKF